MPNFSIQISQCQFRPVIHRQDNGEQTVSTTKLYHQLTISRVEIQTTTLDLFPNTGHSIEKEGMRINTKY